jgi:1-phosphatidylinositol-3-phosphate 5-kinase
LNWQYQLLFLGLYVWDVRLHHILWYIKVNSASLDSFVHESTKGNEFNNSEGIAAQNIPSEKDPGMEIEQGTTNSSNCYNSCGGVISNKAQLTDEHGSPLCQDLDVRLSPASSGEVSVLFTNDEQTATARVNGLYHVVIPSDDTRKWVWNRFSQLEMEYKKELQCGLLDKFHLINKYIPLHSSLIHQKHQIDLGHFTVGPGGSILSVVEEEISSIIAHALTISEQQGCYSEAAFVKDELVDGRKMDKLASSNMDRDASLLSSILFPCDSLEKNHKFIRNLSTLSSEESTSGFYDSFLSALKELHPEICVNNEKIPLKSKYTIVCIYAKQFRDLRKICCPSELAYISSISRCKSWKAQGGKSKVFFAKSMDDRFIIKQIKKTEFDSFLKFGLEYFKHFGEPQISSNPTCLAKILGLYQVCNTFSLILCSVVSS